MPKIFQHNYHVYITTNSTKSVLYIGVTNNLSLRIIQHWQNRGKAGTFAGKYHCYNLVYFEHFQQIDYAIAREKELKGWRRQKKISLINVMNPHMDFFNATICDGWPPEQDISQ